MDVKEMSADGLLKLAQEKIKFEHNDHKYELHERDVLIRNLHEQVRILRTENEQFGDNCESLQLECNRLTSLNMTNLIFFMISSAATLVCFGLYVFYCQ